MMNLEQFVAHMNHFEFFIISFVGFSVLYFSFCAISYYLFCIKINWPKVQDKPFRPGQVKAEIKRSFVSILMFSILGLWLCEGLKRGIYKFNFDFSWGVFLFEAVILFFWNEIYFYIFHRLFHIKALYKYHIDHHYSNVPSPFSAYSFHWSEGLVLGAVMPVVMLFHDFQFYAIMTLPLMSILMNVLGHSNINFFPNASQSSLLSFSKRHSLHHKIPHSNYGFFLPWFDQIFGTVAKD